MAQKVILQIPAFNYLFDMKILIFGAGAVGTYIGVRLAAAGHDVELFGREKIKDVGSEVLVNGKYYNVPRRSTDLVAGSHYDFVFCTTKMYDLPDAILKLSQVKCDVIAFVQNGFFEKSVYGPYISHPGFCTVVSFEGITLKNGLIVTQSNTLGWQSEETLAGTKVIQLLNSVGVMGIVNKNLESLRCEKALLTACSAPLCALYKKTSGELMRDSTLRKKALKLLVEGYEVLRHEYSIGSFEDVQKKFLFTLEANGCHYPSMVEDRIRGKKTEVDFLNGVIITLGKKYGIATPTHEQLYRALVPNALVVGGSFGLWKMHK